MKRHGKRRPGKPVAPAPAAKRKPKGRYGRTWFSAEFVAWCQRHHFNPEGVGSCVLHTHALESTGETIIVRSDSGPIDTAYLYDLDSLKDEGGQTDGQ